MDKNYKAYLEKVKFDIWLKKIIKRAQNKQVIIYGIGNLFQYIYEHYDLSKLNIIGLSDIKFDGENVIVEKSFLDSTSPYMPVPTMMMEYEGQKLEDGTPDTADLNKFISDLFRGYPNGDTAFVEERFHCIGARVRRKEQRQH